MANTFGWQRVRADTVEFKHLDRELLVLVGYALVFIGLGFLIASAIVNHPLPLLGATQFNQDFWYSIVYKLVLLFLVPSFLYFGLWGYRLKDLLLGSRVSLKAVVAGVVMAGLGFLLNIGHLKAIQENYAVVSIPQVRLAVGIVTALLTAAIPEEIFFRGMLQTRLEKKYNRSLAILTGSLLFAAWHLPTRYMLSRGVEGQAGDWGQIALHTGLPVLIAGLLFAVHWSRYRNIVVLIATHWAIDILPSVSSYFKIPF